MFFAISVMATVLFFFNAQKWKRVMLIWSEKEAPFLRQPYIREKWFCLRMKINSVAYFILGLGVIEHTLLRVSNIELMDREIQYCNYTVDSRLEYYAKRNFGHYFEVIHYHPSIAVGCYVRFKGEVTAIF